MTDERRYHDEEVAQIFQDAATPRISDPEHPSSSEGLTLTELQAIGREVGVAPERIADAATALDLHRSKLPARRSLSKPISAGRTVPLPRAPTDREWELLLGELRETFHAQGRDASRGGVRQWSNGNLHAYIEPTENAYRLRMGTSKGDALPLDALGIAGLLAGLIILIPLILAGELASVVVGPLIFLVFGAAALGYNALRLPRWAAEREEQMEYIAARAGALLGPVPGEGTTHGSGG